MGTSFENLQNLIFCDLKSGLQNDLFTLIFHQMVQFFTNILVVQKKPCEKLVRYLSIPLFLLIDVITSLWIKLRKEAAKQQCFSLFEQGRGKFLTFLMGSGHAFSPLLSNYLLTKRGTLEPNFFFGRRSSMNVPHLLYTTTLQKEILLVNGHYKTCRGTITSW